MIFHKPCKIVTDTCMWTTLAFFLSTWDVTEVENVLNKDFVNVHEWFIDNKLSIYVGEDKNK